MNKRQRRDGVASSMANTQRNQQVAAEYSNEVKGLRPDKQVQFKPSTARQEEMVVAVNDNPVSVIMGPAGVGKTFVAASLAATMLYKKGVSEIILTRANVKVGDDIGMLPGTIEEKMAPLLAPILSALERQMGKGDYAYCINKQKIKMLPFEYVRGRSFYDAFVIVDEAQNLKPAEIQALCTRYETGKIVMLGDPFQHDLKDAEPGIEWLKNFVKRRKVSIPVVECGIADVVRSGFVKMFLTALYKDLGRADTPAIKKPTVRKPRKAAVPAS